MAQKCGNCKHRYENYLKYEEGPCEFFGDESGEWENIDVIANGCEFWEEGENERDTIQNSLPA